MSEFVTGRNEVCTFCGSTAMEVEMMVAAPDGAAHICGACIEIARDVLGKHRLSKDYAPEIVPVETRPRGKRARRPTS